MIHAGTKARISALLAALIVGTVAVPVAGASSTSSGTSRVPTQSADGAIRIAAEEEPDCADWIASCAGSSWGNWILGNLTLPQALNVNAEGDYVPGAILVDEPTIDPGPPMKVTYRIRPEAVWSDGQPIRSQDFAYTWEQVVSGKDVLDDTGYVQIESIDTTDPKVAVVTFKAAYAAWRDLFGGIYYVLPSHLLEGKNRHKILKDGYAFSAGPWRLDGGKKGWKKGVSMTLVPNESFWGTLPSINKVVFQFIPETAAELDAVKTGQVVAAYPLPQTGILDEISERPNLASTVGFGNQLEMLFLNNQAAPLDSTPVRQAVEYATDRQAIVDQILKPAIGEGRVLQSFIPPNFKQYYTPSFEMYARDLDKVDQLMTSDGWVKKKGVWTKNGKKAVLEVSTIAGNESRRLTEELWASQLKQAGFQLRIRNQSIDTLIGRISEGRYSVFLLTSVGTPDPGLCFSFCSENIPTEENQFSGQNYTRTSNSGIDASWKAVDADLDTAARIAAAQQGQDALAREAVAIPLFQQPTIFVWDTQRIAGNIEDNTVMGPFFTMNEWTLQ